MPSRLISLFKGDLIANACVLNKLNKDTTESTAVLEYWNYSTSTLDSTFNKGNTMYYSGTDYMSYIYGSRQTAASCGNRLLSIPHLPRQA